MLVGPNLSGTPFGSSLDHRAVRYLAGAFCYHLRVVGAGGLIAGLVHRRSNAGL
jgi:hypothetical protein